MCRQVVAVVYDTFVGQGGHDEPILRNPIQFIATERVRQILLRLLGLQFWYVVCEVGGAATNTQQVMLELELPAHVSTLARLLSHGRPSLSVDGAQHWGLRWLPVLRTVHHARAVFVIVIVYGRESFLVTHRRRRHSISGHFVFGISRRARLWQVNDALAGFALMYAALVLFGLGGPPEVWIHAILSVHDANRLS